MINPNLDNQGTLSRWRRFRQAQPPLAEPVEASADLEIAQYLLPDQIVPTRLRRAMTTGAQLS
ncbi:MAG: hypothetical protein C0183_00645 [Roseiflexus castenholzii]|nr:MAG: hypothetical protein C0183_00645 [Roseiflexus castenholzii]